MSDNKIVPFRLKNAREPLQISTVEMIGFQTSDDRDLWISDPVLIQKIMMFIIREKIPITEEE